MYVLKRTRSSCTTPTHTHTHTHTHTPHTQKIDATKESVPVSPEDVQDLALSLEGNVRTALFIEWLHEVTQYKECGTKRARDISHVSRKISSQPCINVEAFIRLYEVDPGSRFDIAFCRHQQRVAGDSLALLLYIPFIFIFSYFLIEGKGLNMGYWMNANIEGFFLEQEFQNNPSLRFVKTFWDVGSDGEFWEFVDGPLLGGLWAGADATELVQQGLMPVGALKMRQIRVKPTECQSKLNRMYEENVDEFLDESDGSAYVKGRMKDFQPLCYPELSYRNTNSDEGPYPVRRELHDGIRAFSMNHTTNPNGYLGSLRGSDSLPPMFLDQIFMDDTMTVKEDERFVLEAFQYHSCSDFNASTLSWLRGKMNVYHCHGHGMVFPFSWNVAKVKKAMAVMQNGLTVTYTDPISGNNVTTNVPWLDAQTRMLSFELIFYSKGLNLFSHAHFLVERVSTGAYIPVKHLTAFCLFDWEEHGFAYYFFLAVFGLYTVVYSVNWIRVVWRRTMRCTGGPKLGISYWVSLASSLFHTLQDFWLVYDLVNLSLILAGWIFRIRTWQFGLTDQTVLQTHYYPKEYESVAMNTQLNILVTAGSGLLTFCRVFSYLRLNPHLNILTKTVSRAAPALSAIFVIFMVVFASFSLLTHTIYGLTIYDFRTFDQTVAALGRMAIGDFNFHALHTERRIMTPLIFVLYNVLTVFILLNLVIAILDQAHSEVMAEKFNPAKLLAVMKNSDDPELQVRGDENRRVVKYGLLLSNPIGKEVSYMLRMMKLYLLLLTGQYSRADERWQKKVEAARRRNPRLYWQMRLRDMENNLNTYDFTDKCRLFDRDLNTILRETFGKDFSLLYSTLVLHPSKRTQRSQGSLLRSILEFHHMWKLRVEAVTQTGKTVKAAEEAAERERERKMLLAFKREQEKHKEESKNDTRRRLKLKFGRYFIS